MNALAAGGFAVAGALAEIPITAIAYSVPAHGSIRAPQRWWRGAPAPPLAIVSASLLAGAVAGVVAIRLPHSPALPAFLLFGVFGVGLTIIDLRRHRLPHAMTGALWLMCAVAFAIESLISGHVDALIVPMLEGLAVVVLALVIALALPGHLGLGDVSLLGVITMSLGWLHMAAVGLTIGICIQTIIALAMIYRNRARPRSLPLGPALLLGWFLAIMLLSGSPTIS